MQSTLKILIVDDEKAIRDMLSMALTRAGFDVLQAENALKAQASIVDDKPDLVLLDWMMPEVSGIELLRRLRREEHAKELPVIMLTAKDDNDNKVQGLECGADDYVLKPFSSKELIARINAVLRRSGKVGEVSDFVLQNLRVDRAAQRTYINESPVKIAPTEFRLLDFFITHQNRVYSRSQILDRVWGVDAYIDERTVDVHIRRLRKVLSNKNNPPGCETLIQTVRGSGYRFSAEV